MNSSTENQTIEVSAPERLADAPVLSVMMITYNHESYLSQALDIILAQKTDFQFEVLIGEDCSSDNTRQVALEYQRRFPDKIRVLYSTNNVGSSRNFARTLEACRGKYVAICEGDDYWTDECKLAEQVAWMDNHPRCAVTYHNATTINEKDEVVRVELQSECQNGYTSEALQVGAHMPTLTLCFRNVVRQLPTEFFRVVNSDTFFISILGCHGYADYLTWISPAVYRHHSGGIWSAVAHDEKIIKGLTSIYWLSLYHRREGRDRLANVLVYHMIGMLLQRFVPKAGLAPKWFLTFVFPDWYQKLRALVRIFKNTAKPASRNNK